MEAKQVKEKKLKLKCSSIRLCLSFYVLILLLMKPAYTGTIRGTVTACHPRDRDPCANFPELCSAGNGLCVVKKPCEYECVCPPDGRVGRDCSNGKGQASEGTSQGSVGGSGTSSNDKQLDSLLVFPPDLFWDLNHVEQQNDLIKTIPTPGENLQQPTIYSTSLPGIGKTTTVASASSKRNEVRKESTPLPTTAKITIKSIATPTVPIIDLLTTLAAEDMTTLSTTNKPHTLVSSRPTTADLTSVDTETKLSLETKVDSSAPSRAMPLFSTQNPESQTTALSYSPTVFSETVTYTPILSLSTEGIRTDFYLKKPHNPLPHSIASPNTYGTLTSLHGTTSSLRSITHTPSQNFGQDNTHEKDITSGYDNSQNAADAPQSTTPLSLRNTDPTIINNPVLSKHPVQSNFTTIFTGNSHHAVQDTSENRALHRTS